MIFYIEQFIICATSEFCIFSILLKRDHGASQFLWIMNRIALHVSTCCNYREQKIQNASKSMLLFDISWMDSYLIFHCPLDGQVCLVSRQCDHNAGAGLSLQLFDPSLCSCKRFLQQTQKGQPLVHKYCASTPQPQLWIRPDIVTKKLNSMIKNGIVQNKNGDEECNWNWVSGIQDVIK